MAKTGLVTVETIVPELRRSFISMREFADLTVKEALDILQRESPEIKPPYQVNGVDVPRNSDRVLKEGDVLTIDPPGKPDL